MSNIENTDHFTKKHSSLKPGKRVTIIIGIGLTIGAVMIGVVSIGDLVKAQLNQYKGDLDTLQTQLMAT